MKHLVVDIWRFFWTKVFVLKDVAKHLLKTPVLESLFHKVAADFNPATFLIRDFSTGAQ